MTFPGFPWTPFRFLLSYSRCECCASAHSTCSTSSLEECLCERGQRDICFMSAGGGALGSGVIGVGGGGWNTDLSFLKDALRTSAPTAWGGATERETRGRSGGRRKEGRGRREGWVLGGGGQCVWGDKLGGGGGTRGPKTSASVLSPTAGPYDLSAETTHTHTHTWRSHLEPKMVPQRDATEEPFLFPHRTFKTRVL